MRTHLGSALLSVALAGALLSTPVSAAEEPRWFLELDLFSALEHTTTARYDAQQLGVGTRLSLEDQLGIEDEPSHARFSIGRRIGAARRHEIELSYVDIHRDGGTTLANGLTIGGIVLPVGVDVLGVADATDIELNYKYYFLSTDRGELGIIGGFHSLDFRSSVTAIFTPFGPFPIEVPIRIDADLSSVVPVVGLRGDVELAPKWHLNGSLKIAEGELGDIDGSFVEVQVAVEHHTFRHLGFGLGFFGDDLDGTETSTDAVILGTYDQQREGVFLFLRSRF